MPIDWWRTGSQAADEGAAEEKCERTGGRASWSTWVRDARLPMKHRSNAALQQVYGGSGEQALGWFSAGATLSAMPG